MIRKFALALGLAALSATVQAEWVKAGDSDEATLYVDPTSKRKDGDSVLLWSLMDFREGPGAAAKPYRSIQSQYQWHCKEARGRTLYYSWHSGPMGSGKTVNVQNSPLEWRPVSAGSFMAIMRKAACE